MSLRKINPAPVLGILCGLLAWFYSPDLQAQLRVGPKAGFQLGRTVYDDAAYRQEFSSGFRPGMMLGAVLNYRVTELYSLQTELFYSQKGKRSRYRGRSVNMSEVKNSALYDYIDLPVLLRMSKHKRYKNSKLEYYVNIGPNLNYWLGGRGVIHSEEYYEHYDRTKMPYRVRFDDEYRDGEFSVYISDANRLQMSLDFGAGLIFDLGRGRSVMVDLRNSLGVGKTYMGRVDSGDYKNHLYQDNFEAVNHVFGISATYLMDIDVQAFLQKGRRTR